MRRIIEKIRNYSFHRKLLLYSLLLSIVPVVLLGTISTYIAVNKVQEEVEQNHQIILKQIQDQVDTFLQQLENLSIQLATNPAIEKSIPLGPTMVHLEETLDMKQTLNKYRSYSDINYDISLVYSQYDLVYSNRYGLINLAEFPYRNTIEGATPKYNESVIIPPGMSEDEKELLLIRPVPLSMTKAPDGLLILHVDVDKLSSFLERVNLGGERKLFVVDDQGRIVMSPNVGEMGVRLASFTDLYHFWSSPDTFHGPISLGGVKYNLSAHPSIFNDWTYIAMTPAEELTEKANQIKQISWIMVALLILLWLFIAIIGSRRMYLPIRRLTTNFSLDLNKRGKNELKTLGSAIHDMVSVNQQLKSQLNEQLPYLRESLFLQLLRGTEDKRIGEKLAQLGFPLQGLWFYVMVIEIDQVAKFRNMYDTTNQSLILYALRKVIEETCEETMPCMIVSPQPMQITLAVGVEQVNEETDNAVLNLATILRQNVAGHFQFTVTATVSRARQGHYNISKSYQECLSLLSYRLIWGHNVTISKNEINSSMKMSNRVFFNVQKQIVSDVVSGDLGGAGDRLSEMIELIPRYVQNPERVLGLLSNLILEMDRKIQEMGYELGDFFTDDLYDQLYRMTSLKEVESWFFEMVFPTINQKLENMNMSMQKRMIQQVLLYVKENYEKDISLQHLADQFELSVSQLSRVFKEETKYNFGDYLIYYRMEKAKEWLTQTDMPIREVAERLRYTTVQSFTRVFKRVTGSPPGQYRKEAR